MRAAPAVTLASLLLMTACSASPSEPVADAAPGGATASPAATSVPAGSTSTPDAAASSVQAQADFARELRRKLSVPALPSFSIPTDLVSSERSQQVSDELDLQPGLYQGIAVVDASCETQGSPTPADQGAAGDGAAEGAGHFEDGTRTITVAGDGTGVYDAPGLHIAVLPGGAGVYDDGTTRFSVSPDGSGTYTGEGRRLTVRADGSGSFSEGGLRVWVGEDGAGGYDDGTTRVSLSSTGEVFSDGDPAHVAAALEVLRDGLPTFPPVPAIRRVQPVEKVCGSVIRLDANVLFDFDSASLRPEAEALLRRVATLLVALDSPEAQVAGHTDQVGDAAYNMDLSQRRADAVRDVLVEHGVDASAVRSRGHGETTPLATETRDDGSDDPAARQLNRRVEVVLKN